MKNFTLPTNLKVALLSLLLVSFIFSCENEPVDAIQNSSSKSKAQFGLRVYEDADCAVDCLEADSDDYFIKSENQTIGNKNQEKSVTYFAYNTQTDFVVEVLYEITAGQSNAHATITIDINGDQIVEDEIETGTTVTHSIPLAEGWAACDEIPFYVKQEGLTSPVEFTSSYSLIGICPEGCEETFYYEWNDEGYYVFTYISEENLANAEVKFTAPHITGYTAVDEKSYTVNPGNSHGSPTVLTYVGDIQACTPITFALAFDADCEQNAAGFANLFTDFKVNGISKKGENPNIRFDCNN